MRNRRSLCARLDRASMFEEIVGSSSALRSVLAQVRRLRRRTRRAHLGPRPGRQRAVARPFKAVASPRGGGISSV